MGKVAVLIASYNGEKYITEQIESIRKQVGVELDIFLQDDCSKDNTVAISRNFLSDGNIKVNSSPTGSAANNFFLMVKEFKQIDEYEYFAFADQDDIWLPHKLQKAITQLEQKQASLYFSNLLIWDTEDDSKSLLKKDFGQKKYDYLFEGGSAGCTYVFTKDFLKILRDKLYATNYRDWKDFSHDWFTYFVARIKGLPVVNSSDTEIMYRIHGDNVHGQLNTVNLQSIVSRLKMIRSGWFINNAVGFAKCVSKDSEEFLIYKKYCKNFFTRFSVLYQHRFQLIRSKRKFVQFFALSLFLTPYLSKQEFHKHFCN